MQFTSEEVPCSTPMFKVSDQDAIPVAGGGNPNPRRESAQAGREAAARSGEGGARRRKQSGKCERSRGRGGQKKKIQEIGRAHV